MAQKHNNFQLVPVLLLIALKQPFSSYHTNKDSALFNIASSTNFKCCSRLPCFSQKSKQASLLPVSSIYLATSEFVSSSSFPPVFHILTASQIKNNVNRKRIKIMYISSKQKNKYIFIGKCTLF